MERFEQRNVQSEAFQNSYQFLTEMYS